VPGPAPKPAALRQRRNATSTRAVLRSDVRVVMPELPERRTEDGEPEWHPLVVLWWRDLWSSPMAPEYHSSDVHGLLLIAQLRDQFWREPTQALAAELRLQQREFGLTPLSRRTLQWEIERAEEAQERGRRRREAAASGAPVGDPRRALQVVDAG
jgi:hypothetical protein